MSDHEHSYGGDAESSESEAGRIRHLLRTKRDAIFSADHGQTEDMRDYGSAIVLTLMACNESTRETMAAELIHDEGSDSTEMNSRTDFAVARQRIGNTIDQLIAAGVITEYDGYLRLAI